MPIYVYGCSDKGHGEREVVHGYHEETDIRCQVCGEACHRIMQPLLAVGRNALEVLYEDMDRGFREWKAWRLKNPEAPEGTGGPIGWGDW